MKILSCHFDALNSIDRGGVNLQYRNIPGTDISLSTLGLGCMRFPVHQEDQNQIDEEKAVAMIRHSIDKGVNFIDTAHPYHGGNSELVVGKALQEGYRQQTFLSTKLPVVKMESERDFDKLLEEQLQKLQTDWIDFYFLHALNPMNWEKVKEFDLLSKLDKAKMEGKIRFPSFSFHAGTELFKEIVDAYTWTMTLVQFNYLDEHYQAGIEGIKYAYDQQVGIAVMEPLRGGKLAQELPEQVAKIITEAPVERSAADWGLRWVLDHPEVTTVLSGMSNMEQIDENIEITSKAHINTLSDVELNVIQELKQVYQDKMQVGCTNCRYCLPCEPVNIPIPSVLTIYNDMYMFEDEDKAKERYQRLIESDRHAEKCIKCGTCEKECPQDIPIIDWMERIHSQLSS